MTRFLKMTTRLVTLALLALGATGACTKKPTDPTKPVVGDDANALRARFTAGVAAYLDRRGDLCVDRPTWPIDVTEADLDRGTRDALQLPVLERLGVVEGRAALHMRRYQLTALGHRAFLDRRTRQPVAPEEHDKTHGDLCVARLTLDEVVGWELHPDERNPTSAVVSYTYAVDAVPWMNDSAARRAFPAVARLIAGAHKASLTENFSLVKGSWIANELLSAPGAGTVAARSLGAVP